MVEISFPPTSTDDSKNSLHAKYEGVLHLMLNNMYPFHLSHDVYSIFSCQFNIVVEHSADFVTGLLFLVHTSRHIDPVPCHAWEFSFRR